MFEKCLILKLFYGKIKVVFKKRGGNLKHSFKENYMRNKENGVKAFFKGLWINDDSDADFYESIAGEPQEVQEALIASRDKRLRGLEITHDASTRSNSASRKKSRGVIDKVKPRRYFKEPEDSRAQKDVDIEREFSDF